jgi:hypothetical protein
MCDFVFGFFFLKMKENVKTSNISKMLRILAPTKRPIDPPISPVEIKGRIR